MHERKSTHTHIHTFVGVKCSEDVLSKLGGVSVRKERRIDHFELLYCEVATRTVLEESFIPLL